MPVKTPEPSPWSTKRTPLGSAPDTLSARAAGYPGVVVTVNDEDAPAVKAVAAALVNAAGCSTVRTNDCVASGSAPFAAVIAIG